MENGEGFCVDARTLHGKLVEKVKVNKDGKGIKGDVFSQWIKRRLSKYKFIENNDFIHAHKNVNVKFTDEEIKNMSQQQMARNKITIEYKLTLDMAKQLCMIQNNDLGILCRKYFILIEKTLKNYESWNNIRNPEKEGNKEMNLHIANWCNRNNFDNSIRQFYQRENNLLNKCLTGLDAQEIRCNIGYRDINTREHLTIEINNALYNLQKLNISLLDANMSFEERKRIIQITCDNQYSNLKMG